MGWRELYRMAEDRHGVVHARDIPVTGLTVQAVSDRARREGWSRPYRGCWILPGRSSSPRERASAAVLVAGEGAVLDGFSGLWALGLSAAAPTIVDVAVPWGRAVTRAPFIKVRRSRHLADGDVASARGLPTTTAGFNLARMGDRLDTDTLRSHVIDARQRGLLDLVDMAERLAAMPRIPGRRVVTAVIGQLTADGSDSVFERRVRRRLRDDGFDVSSGPVAVRAFDGRTVHVDMQVADLPLAIECQGFGAHSTRVQLDRDARRANALSLLRSWVVLELTWDRFVTDWPGFRDELRSAVASLGRADSGTS